MRHLQTLKKASEFKRVYRKGKRVRTAFFDVIKVRNELGYNRFGISVSKKVGNSVRRHRLIRLTRDVLCDYRDASDQSFDIVVYWKIDDRGLKRDDVATIMKECL